MVATYTKRNMYVFLYKGVCVCGTVLFQSVMETKAVKVTL